MNIEHLNEAQRQAVLHTDGPVMILAGAGSGKTRTLVSRIQYLLGEKQVSPFQLLAVTFSNKAAREMRERIAHDSSTDIGALQITTFHAFCAKVLRTEANYLGLSRNFTIYDDGESKSIIKAVLNKRGISLKELSPNAVMYAISEFKNNGHYPNCPVRDAHEDLVVDTNDEFYQYYLEYEQELHRSNAVDFGGLITGVIQLFEQFPAVLERYQKRFRYILVDEYQDTNRAQFMLLRNLCGSHNNICVVGDEDQSIYSWRGADIRNILDFEKIYPDAKLIKLEQNYRSSKNIIEAASHLISRNEMRKGKEMWTDNPEGESIRIVECRDDYAEGDYIAEQVRKLYSEGASLRDIAVFYRNNSQSRMLEDSLRKVRLPYKVVGGIKFYERKEVKDMLSYLRVVVNAKDSLALSRIVNVPARGIGATSLRKLEDEAVKQSSSLFEIIEAMVDKKIDAKHLKLSGKIQTALYTLVSLIQEVKALDEQKELPSVSYEKLLHESGYLEALKADKNYESLARIENLEELLSAIKQYEQAEESPSLVGFLETITLDSETEDQEFDGQQLSLMTVHGSKGLEYPYVFLVGAEENLFPSFKSMEVGDVAIEEERRLFYVAMTRAMKKLTITFARGRMLWGSIKFNGPSRFIHEIPDKYYDWKFYKVESTSASTPSFAGKSSIRDGIDYGDEYSQMDSSFNDEYTEKVYVQPKVTYHQSKYPKGSRIVHDLYGEGLVLETEGFGQDEKVVIKFSEGTRKKFMVKFAPLQLL